MSVCQGCFGDVDFFVAVVATVSCCVLIVFIHVMVESQEWKLVME